MHLTILLSLQRYYKKPWYEELFDAIIGGEILTIILVLLLLVFIMSLFFRKRKDYHSNWNTLLKDFDYSTMEFYSLLRQELKSQGMKNIDISNREFFESSVFSAKRLYLKVRWKGFQYYICGAPFGNGFFVSWWLFHRNPILKILISKIPFIGGWLARRLFPVTFYSIDTASMFMTYAHESVLTVIDKITKEKGTRALAESERKPILNNVFKR